MSKARTWGGRAWYQPQWPPREPPRGRVMTRGELKPLVEMFESLGIGLAIAVVVILVLLTACTGAGVRQRAGHTGGHRYHAVL